MTTEQGAPTRSVAVPSLQTPTLTKAELAELLFERLGLNKRESKDMVEAFFELVHATLVEGRDVKLSGFGNFNIRRKAPRPGRNPRTGEAIPIKARHVVTFHASHKLKSIVQGDTPADGVFEYSLALLSHLIDFNGEWASSDPSQTLLHDR